ncbi:MAG: heparinase II/III family protein [Terriglobia bacterium]
MKQFTRREFLVTPCVLAAPMAGLGQTQAAERDLLTSAWPAAKLDEVLTPRERFHPFPTVSERAAWDALPADARAALLDAGEKQLKTPWEALPATLFLEYRRTGNRSHYEEAHERRRRKLRDLVLAECMEGQGRFADEITNGVWLTCEETYWGRPAHLGLQKAGTGLPDVSEPTVDLFAAETSNLLAWTSYLMGDLLARVSPLVPERIRLEIDRRILTPCLTRNDFWWMGFADRAVNNWDPWICSNWLTSALLLEINPERRRAAAAKILRCLDNFLNVYADDGGCDEGPGYWGRAGASLFDCLELLHAATAGHYNGFTLPLVHQIALYICRAHIYNDWYTNFGDGEARMIPDGDVVYRFGKRVGDDRIMADGAFCAFEENEKAIPGGNLGRRLPALFNLATLRQSPRAQALFRDTWLPGIQVMMARVREGSGQGLYLAAQAGNNGKSHNHNDVGNFMVYADGMPAIIDVGVETYTAKTFSPQRYEIWTMQSAYHNCPTIDGVMQSPGRQFASTDVGYHADNRAAELRLNLAKAYPTEAHLASWNRTLRLDRVRNAIEIVDDYRLTQAAKVITLTLMTPCAAQVSSPGEIRLPLPAGDPVRIAYDARVFHAAVEEIPLNDEVLRHCWGERLYRVLLRADAPPLQSKWSLHITR